MTTTATPRLLLPDALRGVAASMVALFHFYMAAHIGLPDGAQLLPQPLHALATAFDGGVHVFFLLSGFILAYSLQSAVVTPAFAMRFLVRRSFRLDPVYWFAIALAISLVLVKGGTLSIRDVPFNMFYADNLTANLAPVHSFVAVGWTLQFEFQFYIIFIVMCAFDRAAAGQLFVPLHAALLALSFFFSLSGGRDVVHGLFLEHWPLFALGVMTVRTTHAPTFAIRVLWVGAIVVNVVVAAHDRNPRPLLGVAAALLFSTAPRPLLLHPVSALLQFLGKISYSLYLFHPFVGIRLIRMSLTHCPDATPAVRAVLVALAFGVSVVVSAAVWWALERPAHALSRRIPLNA
jgi:peptidoglycan/LPS O-acetylase OafA/YrhL